MQAGKTLYLHAFRIRPKKWTKASSTIVRRRPVSATHVARLQQVSFFLLELSVNVNHGLCSQCSKMLPHCATRVGRMRTVQRRAKFRSGYSFSLLASCTATCGSDLACAAKLLQPFRAWPYARVPRHQSAQTHLRRPLRPTLPRHGDAPQHQPPRRGRPAGYWI